MDERAINTLVTVEYDLNQCLTFNPFEGDFGCGDEVLFQNKIVTARKEHSCHHCNGKIEAGSKYRLMTEKVEGNIKTFRWCGMCCVAMIIDAENGGFCFDNRQKK